MGTAVMGAESANYHYRNMAEREIVDFPRWYESMNDLIKRWGNEPEIKKAAESIIKNTRSDMEILSKKLPGFKIRFYIEHTPQGEIPIKDVTLNEEQLRTLTGGGNRIFYRDDAFRAPLNGSFAYFRVNSNGTYNKLDMKPYHHGCEA